jgi:hypothetical protein
MKIFSAGRERGLPPGIDVTRRVACPQPPNPSPIRRKTLGRPGTRVFFFARNLLPAYHQMVPMHHLGAAPEAEDHENIGR